MKPSGALRLTVLTGIVGLVVAAYAMSAQPVNTWSTSITATGQVRVGEFGPLDAIVELRPDPLVAAEGGQSIEALVAIPSADVRLADPSSIRLCAGNGDCGASGAVPASFEVDSSESQLVLGFADVAAAGLPTTPELVSDAVEIRLAVSGQVAGRAFVGSDSLAVVPPSTESPADEWPSPTASEPPDSPSDGPASDPSPPAPDPGEPPTVSPAPIPPEPPNEAPVPEADESPSTSPEPDPPQSPEPEPEPVASQSESPALEPPASAAPAPDTSASTSDGASSDMGGAADETPSQEPSVEVTTSGAEPTPAAEPSSCPNQAEPAPSAETDDMSDVPPDESACDVGQDPAAEDSSSPGSDLVDLPILVLLSFRPRELRIGRQRSSTPRH